MKTSILIGSVLLALLYPGELSAQYWGERVLEKSFEQTEFFFVPFDMSPYAIGNFKSATPGLLRDPLLDAILNPALLTLDSGKVGYFYTDFRSSRNVKEEGTGFYPPWIYGRYAAADYFLPFPSIYVRSRRQLEPVFSGAAFGRPFPTAVPGLVVGVTYQLVLQDEKYYNIPQDIYRSALGYDYNGLRSAGADNIPIVDRFNGEDNMHQTGNFVSAFIRYDLPSGIELGGKLSRVSFNRNGAYGSSNLWGNTPGSTGASLWSNLESRDQSYTHSEVAAGVRFPLDATTKFGLSAGYLWGDATQALRNNDSSYYSYGSLPNFNFYNRSGNTVQVWRHDGKTASLGMDMRTAFTPSVTATLSYLYRGTSVDIGVGSNILDTSYSTYTWSDTVPHSSYSQSYLSDSRSGGGTQKITTSRASASVDIQIDEKVRLAIGGVMEWQNTETDTRETALVSGRSAYWSSYGYNSTYGQGESKDLVWTFRAKRTTFQIPLFVTVKATRALELLFGLNRTMTSWSVDDVTLAIFRYRETLNNGSVNREENFGERYTQPSDRMSDVRTTFLAGLTVTPTAILKIRLLMVPNFKDTYDGSELEQMQWWIGVTLTP